MSKSGLSNDHSTESNGKLFGNTDSKNKDYDSKNTDSYPKNTENHSKNTDSLRTDSHNRSNADSYDRLRTDSHDHSNTDSHDHSNTDSYDHLKNTASHDHSKTDSHDHSNTDSHDHSKTDSDKIIDSHAHSNNKASASDHSHSHSHSHSHEGSLFGHSHSHDHHQPNELLSTSSASIVSNPAVRITWIGLLVNISMVLSKGIGGVYFHSQALIADAIHSVSDMFADFLTLATVNVAAKVGTPTHFPLGYGKIETVGSFLVSGVLLFAGISVGWSSLLQIFEFTLPHYLYEYVSMIQVGHSHSHGADLLGGGASDTIAQADPHSHSHSHVSSDELASDPHSHRNIPNINAAWLAGASIIVKELLFRKTMQVAVETNSKVLVANAWHHRVDSLTAFVALLTVTGGVLFNVAWLDSIGGVCVSLLIIKAGWGTFKSSWYELIDRGESKDSEFYAKIQSIVENEVESVSPGNFNIENLSVMSSGANTNIYITLKTIQANNFQLSELNQIESSLTDAIKKDDKFVRNIFVSFKESPIEKATDSAADVHTHTHE